jgi:hypothetical protein
MFYPFITLSHHLVYAARYVNYTRKLFLKLSPVANFIRLFGLIMCYQCIALSLHLGHTARVINYTPKKLFLKLSPVFKFIKLFCGIIMLISVHCPKS